jgi:hypothetical protein
MVSGDGVVRVAMTEHYTNAAVQRRYAAEMGIELAEVFSKFFHECAGLHAKWNECIALFGTNQGRIDILNSAASGFFGMVQRVLWEDVLLHICRLTDDRKVGRRNRETLSIFWLCDLCGFRIF